MSLILYLDDERDSAGNSIALHARLHCDLMTVASVDEARLTLDSHTPQFFVIDPIYAFAVPNDAAAQMSDFRSYSKVVIFSRISPDALKQDYGFEQNIHYDHFVSKSKAARGLAEYLKALQS